MNVKLLLGIALFLIGLVAAAVGIISIGDVGGRPLIETEGNTSTPMRQALEHFAIPAVAGLSLALGGLLIGLSMGNWSNPRTHLKPGDEIVDPEAYHKMKHV